jgi:hypothetical protein
MSIRAFFKAQMLAVALKSAPILSILGQTFILLSAE